MAYCFGMQTRILGVVLMRKSKTCIKTGKQTKSYLATDKKIVCKKVAGSGGVYYPPHRNIEKEIEDLKKEIQAIKDAIAEFYLLGPDFEKNTKNGEESDADS